MTAVAEAACAFYIEISTKSLIAISGLVRRVYFYKINPPEKTINCY